MAGKPKVNWKSAEVINILFDDTLGLEAKCQLLGINSKYYLCRKMKQLGIKHNKYWRYNLNRPTTNKERKARYNKKRKAIGWKYLYEVSATS